MKEMADYSGLVNFITTTEAFKNGTQSSTLLRICMNSSMKQLMSYGKSLNDCLMKGPPALMDMFIVTLSMRSMRQHQYALTKDLPKFYQR